MLNVTVQQVRIFGLKNHTLGNGNLRKAFELISSYFVASENYNEALRNY